MIFGVAPGAGSRLPQVMKACHSLALACGPLMNRRYDNERDTLTSANTAVRQRLLAARHAVAISALLTFSRVAGQRDAAVTAALKFIQLAMLGSLLQE